MIILLILLLASELHAQNCMPTDRLVYQSLQGCDAIRKREETEVVLPGYSERVIQEGTGQCEKKVACGLANFIQEKEQCWPQFKSPQVSYGSWVRSVVDARVVIGYAGTCSEQHGDYVEQVPIFGPRCAEGEERFARVYHPCETAGGPILWINTLPPTLDPDPCYWSWLAGIPCWSWPYPSW